MTHRIDADRTANIEPLMTQDHCTFFVFAAGLSFGPDRNLLRQFHHTDENVGIFRRALPVGLLRDCAEAHRPLIERRRAP